MTGTTLGAGISGRVIVGNNEVGIGTVGNISDNGKVDKHG